VGKPWVAFWVVNIMYVLNASFIAGVAVNVIDIGAKYAGSIMALTHEFATGAGFLLSVITGALVKRRGHYENAFAVALGVNIVSFISYMGFSSFTPIFPQEEVEDHYNNLDQDTKDFNNVEKNSIWAKYWPRRWNIMIFCCMADLICYMDRANISATMIPMAKKYGWTKSFEGICFGVFFLGLMASHLIGGYLSDRWGAKNVLIFGVIWWSLFTILTPPSAVHPWLIVLVRFLMGTGEGVNFPAVYSLFSEWFPRDEEDILVTITENGVYAGIVIAMMCVPLIEHYLGWEPVFYIFGSLGFVWAALFAIYGGSSPQDLCYDVDKHGKLELTGLMDPREVKYIEATRAKGPTKKKAKGL
jgi:MFS family permease